MAKLFDMTDRIRGSDARAGVARRVFPLFSQLPRAHPSRRPPPAPSKWCVTMPLRRLTARRRTAGMRYEWKEWLEQVEWAGLGGGLSDGAGARSHDSEILNLVF